MVGSKKKSSEGFCRLCYPQQEEVIALTFNLASLILKEHECLPEVDLQKEQLLEAPEALQKLVRLIFHRLPGGNDKCTHDILLEFLVAKTELPKRRIFKVVNRIYQVSAKRNYELEVLVGQIKNFPKRILQELGRKKTPAQFSSNCSKEEQKVAPTQSENQLLNVIEPLMFPVNTSVPPCPVYFPWMYPGVYQMPPGVYQMPPGGFFPHPQ